MTGINKDRGFIHLSYLCPFHLLSIRMRIDQTRRELAVAEDGGYSYQVHPFLDQ